MTIKTTLIKKVAFSIYIDNNIVIGRLLLISRGRTLTKALLPACLSRQYPYRLPFRVTCLSIASVFRITRRLVALLGLSLFFSNPEALTKWEQLELALGPNPA